MTPEEEILEKIKYVLSFGNDAQAIRLIEQYGHWKQEQVEQCAINGVVKSLPTETDDFLNYIKETCITDCNDWHSLLHNKQFESNNDLYKQYIKDKK